MVCRSSRDVFARCDSLVSSVADAVSWSVQQVEIGAPGTELWLMLSWLPISSRIRLVRRSLLMSMGWSCGRAKCVRNGMVEDVEVCTV